MKLIALPKRQIAKAGLLACALAATTLSASMPSHTVAAHPPTGARGVPQRLVGTTTASEKTIVNLGDLATHDRTIGGRTPPDASAPAPAGTVRAVYKSAALPRAAARASVAGDAPTLDLKFNGMAAIDSVRPPDANAAAGLNQIVETVNTRMTVYARNGAADTCGTVGLATFFGSPAGETLTDPRVIYDNVANKFTVIVAVDKQSPPSTGPHLPGFPIIRIAHSLTSNACGAWNKYSLLNIAANDNDIGDGDFIDQPAIGQDRNAFLFAGAEYSAAGSLVRFVAFAEPKNCAYDDIPDCSYLPIFSTAHYATPASTGGNPMITTGASYFLASVPNTGYELYRMDNAGNTAQTSLTFQATIAAAAKVQHLTRNAGQPGTASTITLGVGGFDTRIKSTPTFDGTRIWFTHTTSLGTHAAVRYGAINTNFFTETDALALHSPTSDDFNPSIAVAVNGASRTIFLNWAYTDVPAGIPVTDAVAAVTVNVGAADSPLPVINSDDINLSNGGITADDRFGDYSSTMIDPLNFNQACAVTAQEYFDSTAGKWATYISRFGAPGC